MAASVIRQPARLCVCKQTASIQPPVLSSHGKNPPADIHIPFVLRRSSGALLRHPATEFMEVTGEAIRSLFSQIIDFHLCRHDNCWAIGAVVIAK